MNAKAQRKNYRTRTITMTMAMKSKSVLLHQCEFAANREICHFALSFPGGGGGGYSREFWIGVCREGS